MLLNHTLEMYWSFPVKSIHNEFFSTSNLNVNATQQKNLF